MALMDFESVIREALDNGLTFDDIADKFTDALNILESTPANEREQYLDNLDEEVLESYEDESFDSEDAAKLALLTIIDDYPDWTVEDMEQYIQLIQNNIHFLAKLVGKSPMEALQTGLDEVLKDIQQEEKKKKPAATGKAKTDNDVIRDFLKLLG